MKELDIDIRGRELFYVAVTVITVVIVITLAVKSKIDNKKQFEKEFEMVRMEGYLTGYKDAIQDLEFIDSLYKAHE